jgi:hypothetical protein
MRLARTTGARWRPPRRAQAAPSLPRFAVTAGLVQTAPGWPPVTWQIGAVNALAEPLTACAIGLDGSDSAALGVLVAA